MSMSEAELTLVLKARDLASREVGTLERNLAASSGRMGSQFENVGDKLVRRFQKRDIKTLGSGIANSITALATGGSLSDVVGAAGLAMGVSMATQFVINFADKIAGSAAVQAIVGALAPVVSGLVAAASGVGTTIGTVISTAAAVAMAIWPALLVAAIVAGIVFLINNPQIVGKIGAFIADVFANLGKGLAKLGAFLGGIFGAAFDLVAGVVRSAVSGIVGVINGIIGAIRNALAWLADLVAAVNKVPKVPGIEDYGRGGGRAPAHAGGGWVGRRGREIIAVGEQGPEYVNPAGRASAMAAGGQGFWIQGVSERELEEIADRGLYVKLRRAAPVPGRV